MRETRHPEVISVISKHLLPHPHDPEQKERRGITLTFDALEVCPTEDPYGGQFGDHIKDCYEACEGINPAAVPELLKALQFLLDAADTEPSMDIYKAHKETARTAIAAATKGA